MAKDERPAREPASAANPFQRLRDQLGASLPPGPKTASSSPSPRPSPPQLSAERVTVRRERAGRGGKTVTVAEGPGLAGVDLEALARDAARALGVGARVEERALVLQGDQSERLASWLGARGFSSVVRGN